MSSIDHLRAAARSKKLRAFVREPGKRYNVYSSRRKYVVWYDYNKLAWDCNCLARTICAHIVRVQDRETQRLSSESREYEQRHTMHQHCTYND